ncbi:tRNA (adenosine(37)-N6)-threonylcarbamoyltransferase complex dimerization subunit type 1 TsaB [Thalassoglobus polymorphus]|uniref:tRNA threonylcarbamoyladenosine biosynthesis protein TsaB n=1 Tax=Thalassoglobus polymorphus TaxID=2527994 RepID=A0A517QRE3_9PLAN|nr:tRNA (adenosine(37)-N6)-threonylcarbamoyltransferase complex dimerization subunit type 1 TsaB [Thalassoglobus polymorphus]QDT34201.1 tRNA threonylcarbamoyladenosine biosynthesis protein TsaB [Thalassoglobus polymorphus]
MPILGIETSGRSGTIAVVQQQTVLGTTELSATGRRHARTLVPEIGRLLADQGLTMADVEAVAVSLGPGSFTGLRVGVVCAKTLAYSLQRPLVAVDTFLAVAENSGRENQLIWVLDDALRGDVYAGAYQQSQSGEWVCQTSSRLMSLEAFRQQVKAEELVTGPGVTKRIDDLQGLNLLDEAHRLPHARQIGLIGERRIQSGECDDYWTVEPHYMRRSAAEEKADQAC